MAGFKIRREIWKRLDAYGEERVMEDLACGDLNVVTLAETMDISPQMFYTWLRQSKERHRVYKEMRAAMADGLLDEMLEIADGSDASSIAQDRERIRVRQWLAERWNREEYGAPAAAGVNVLLSVGELHLTALKSRARDGAGGVKDGPPALGDGEIVVGP